MTDKRLCTESDRAELQLGSQSRCDETAAESYVAAAVLDHQLVYAAAGAGS